MEISPRQFEIIQSAGKLLSVGGIGNLTTKNLANEMHFSEAALYRHFKSKDEIIIAMLNYLAKSMGERMDTIIENPVSATEKLKTLFYSQFHFFSENNHFLVAIFSDGLWEQNEKIHQSVKNVMAVKRKYLDIIFTEGIQNKEFSKVIGKDSLIHISMGAFRLHMLQWKMSNYAFDVEKKGKLIINDLLKLIKK